MANLVNLANEDVDDDISLKGYDAYDSAGEHIGDIDGAIADDDTMTPRYLVIDAGNWFSSKQFVVPIGDVKQVDENERHISFKTLTKERLQSGSYPKYDDSWWEQNDHQSWNAHERDLHQAYTGTQAERVDYNSDLYKRPAEGAKRLQLMEERLKVNKQQEQAGTVRLGKRITERTETVNVPVREERVVIERTPGSGQAVAGGRELREGETIEVPVMKERVDVGKEAVVAEEVNVRKQATERTEQAQETVRKEELDVKDQGGLVADRQGAPRGERTDAPPQRP